MSEPRFTVETELPAAASRVGLLIQGDDNYGVGQVARLIARLIPGIECIAFNPGSESDEIAALGVPVHVLESGSPFQTFSPSRGFFAAIRQVLQKRPLWEKCADEIHGICQRRGLRVLHGNVFAHYFSLGALRRKYPGCYRTIWHIHNNLNVVRHFGIPARFNWRQARRGADWLLCVSRASAAGWAPSGVATEVVHNCVSPQARVSRPASVASGPLRVVASGRMEWNKGLHVALEALARVLAAGVDMTLDVFGGPLEGNEYFAQLQAMTVELGITKAVQFHGFQSDFIKRLPSYDIALQCRIDPEPFGLYVLECMNIGVPVIASANGGILELLRADVDGLLYPPGDAAALANGLIELARNPARRQQLAENARVRAHEEFSQSIFARRLTQFYSRVGATLPAEDALKCLASASGSAPQKSICYESAI